MAKKPKETPPAKYAVGQFVTIKSRVRVKHRGIGNRRVLVILPGSVWKVESIYEDDSVSRRRYVLSCSGHICHKREWRIRPIS